MAAVPHPLTCYLSSLFHSIIAFYFSTSFQERHARGSGYALLLELRNSDVMGHVTIIHLNSISTWFEDYTINILIYYKVNLIGFLITPWFDCLSAIQWFVSASIPRPLRTQLTYDSTILILAIPILIIAITILKYI